MFKYVLLTILCTEKDPCHPEPCRNNGKCSHDGNGKTECVCPARFKGEKCEGKANNNVKLREIVCWWLLVYFLTGLGWPVVVIYLLVGRSELMYIIHYFFPCIELHNCKPNPCQNEGLCIEKEGKGKFECQCSNQWRGTVCGSMEFCHCFICFYVAFRCSLKNSFHYNI